MSNSPQPSTVLARQIYGPVPSRRLGTSLGVDLVPFKVCSYDCVYCQLGRTRWISCDRGIPSPAAAPISLLGERLRELLARRPCTVEDASRGLSVAPAEVSKARAMLLERGQARREPQGELTYS